MFPGSTSIKDLLEPSNNKFHEINNNRHYLNKNDWIYIYNYFIQFMYIMKDLQLFGLIDISKKITNPMVTPNYFPKS